MKPDNWNRFAAGLLAILLCLCSFSMPAFASGTDPAPEPLPEIIEEAPTTGGPCQRGQRDLCSLPEPSGRCRLAGPAG